MQARNADDLLYAVEAELLGKPAYVPPEPKEETEIEVESTPIEHESAPESEPTETVESDYEVKESKPSEDKEPEEVAAKSTDEYGNELAPPRTYSEEEVNAMIRDRLSRGRHAQEQAPPTQYQQQQAQQQGFTPDPNSSEDWEVQLKNFVKQTFSEISNDERSRAQQEREHQVQAQFQEKFTTGMNRYKDFQSVVGTKPITDAMMLAARGMSDPAAFMYAAAKNHGKELERIAQIPDPYQQGMEIGKLEATMRKGAAMSKATPPLSKTVGDYSGSKKQEVKRTVDSLIQQDAKRKFRR